LKFGNLIIATVSLVLAGLILDAFLKVAFIPLNDDQLSDMLAFIIGFLVASLIVGYMFAPKIHEGSKIKAIGIIAVLSTFTFMLFYAIWIANPFASPWFSDSINRIYDTSGWTNYNWDAYASLMVSVIAIIAFVVTFVGLRAGSILKKPSANTKE
jgi:hypothetical protein